MSSKIIPINGEHESVSSLLAEVMGDDEIESVIVYAFTKEDNCKTAYFNASIGQFAVASLAASKTAMDNMADE